MSWDCWGPRARTWWATLTAVWSRWPPQLGFPVPEFTERRLRATRTAMAERPCWEAQIDLEPLAQAPFPKVVVTGEWDQAHPAYRASAGDALVACGSFVADRIGGRLVQVPGADHFPHRDRSDIVNALLREVWNAAGHDPTGRS